MVKQIIVTADDYGLCAPVDEAIEECLAVGVVRAACVMANMSGAAGAGRLKVKFPRCSVGIHWNLTQGSPVLSPDLVPTLVDAQGRFAGPLRQRWLAGKIKPAEVRAELRAQYQRLRELHVDAEFWNTHQDSHVWPGLFMLFVDCARELGIPAMRCHRRYTIPHGSSVARFHLRHPFYWAKGRLIARWSQQAHRRGMTLPAGRIYFPGYGRGVAALRAALARIDWRRVEQPLELAIHPATRVDRNLFGALTESRIRDYELFRSPRTRAALRELGIEPVSFAALGPRADVPNRESA
jgi:predicted glycoside hydrolase/deacetylase ChbG (UPF0249 family)